MAAINIDFTNVKDSSGLNPRRLPEGDYKAIIKNVVQKDKDGVPMFRFDIQLIDHPRAVYAYYCKIQENQLWKIRNLLLSIGKRVPKKAIKIDLTKLTGSKLGVELVDDEYEGRYRSQVASVFPVENVIVPVEDSPVEGDTQVSSDDDDDDDDTLDFELEI